MVDLREPTVLFIPATEEGLSTKMWPGGSGGLPSKYRPKLPKLPKRPTLPTLPTLPTFAEQSMNLMIQSRHILDKWVELTKLDPEQFSKPAWNIRPSKLKTLLVDIG